jgi:hypothetical protein
MDCVSDATPARHVLLPWSRDTGLPIGVYLSYGIGDAHSWIRFLFELRQSSFQSAAVISCSPVQ